MVRKIYKRFGLRRDQNFGDLSDARSALNNLLDGLVTVPGDTFVSEDLEAIRNINNIGLSNGQYRLIARTTTKYTTSGGDNRNFVPHITFQNRIDKFTVFSGQPRISGGNGPSASYWQKDQIVVNSENSSDDTERKFEYDQDTNSPASEVLAGITTFGALPSDNVWEKGNFTYTGKVHPQSVLTDGGVTWEGYFVPTITGPHTFTKTSTGYTTFDFNRSDYEEDDNKNQTPTSEQIQIDAGVGAGSTYKEWNRVGVTTTILGSGSANTNVITIAADKSKTIGIGMSVSGTGLVTSGNASPIVESYQHLMDGSTATTVTLKPISGQSYAVGGSGVSANTPLTFSRDIGQPVTSSSQTQFLVEFRRYRFRIRFFFPRDVSTKGVDRSIDINFNPLSMTSSDLPYYRLYDLDYSFTEDDKGVFNRFFDASVRFGGTHKIGIGGTLPEGEPNPFADTNPYVKVKTSNKIQAVYSPKTSIAAITKRTESFSSTVGSTVLELASGSTGGIQIGNYVFGPNTDDSTNSVAEGSRVIDIVINKSIVLDRPAQLTATQSLKFIEHRGFVKRVKGAATSNGGTTVNFATGYTTDNTDKWKHELKKDMLVLTTPSSGTDVTAYTSIETVNDSDTITLTNGMTNSANTLIYIYESRGLIDKSLISFCPQTGNTKTRCRVLASGSSAPNNVLTLVDVSDLTNGLTVEGFGIPDNTTMTLGTGNDITLSNNLENDIAGGATVTIHGLAGDRQLCCPPTDTSPPFQATPRGLMTTNANKHLSFTQGNAKFDELRFKFTNSDAANPAVGGRIEKYGTGNTDVTRKIHLKAGATQDQLNGLFYLIGTTS